MEFLHKPVLFEEAIDALALRPDGIDSMGRQAEADIRRPFSSV